MRRFMLHLIVWLSAFMTDLYYCGALTVTPAAIREILTSPCTLVIHAMDSNFIQDILIELIGDDFIRHLEKISPIVVVDKANFDIQALDKFSGCYVGMSSLDNHDSLQDFLLMTDNRQLVLIDTNQPNDTLKVQVHQFHHPITIFKEKERKITQQLACRNGHMLKVNIFIPSYWTLPFTFDPLDLERKCNYGLHPLHGTSMKGTAIVPMQPHYIGDFGNGMVTGGITYDIFKTFTDHYKISFNVTIDKEWILMNEDGTIGGMVGNVVTGDFDFSLDMSLNLEHFLMGLGKSSSFTYYIYTIFLQMKPRQLSSTENLWHCFDNYTWVLLGISLICVTFTLYLMIYLEKKRNTVSFAKVLEITFGNIFQEYSNHVFTDRRKGSAKLNILWVIATMVLSISFVGNLKSILMKKDYELMATTKADIVDMDMKILVRYGMEPILEMYSSANHIDSRLLCQAKKSKGFYKAGSRNADPFYEQVEMIESHNDAALVDEASVNLLKKQYHQQSKNFPYAFIPERYILFPMGMLFKKADFRDQYFNHMIPPMYDSGIMDYIFNKWKSPKGMKEQVTLTEEALTFEHLILPLFFLAGGISLSLIMFATEFWKGKCSG